MSAASYQSGIDNSEAQAATAAKIEALQAELEGVKALLKGFIQSQAAPSGVAEIPLKPAPPTLMANTGLLPPPPPPPPPPPMMPTVNSTGAQSVIKLKVKSELTAVDPTSVSKGEKHPLSRSDGLKGLSSVRLKPTPR